MMSVANLVLYFGSRSIANSLLFVFQFFSKQPIFINGFCYIILFHYNNLLLLFVSSYKAILARCLASCLVKLLWLHDRCTKKYINSMNEQKKLISFSIRKISSFVYSLNHRRFGCTISSHEFSHIKPNISFYCVLISLKYLQL